MMWYSVQHKDLILVKFVNFCLLLKIWAKTLVQTSEVNLAKNGLILLNTLLQMHLKILQKEQFEKKLKQLVIWLVIKLLIKLQISPDLCHRLVQRQLQIK